MSLIENLSNDKHLSQLSEIIYDENNRYVKLNRRIKFSNQIQQSTITGYFSLFQIINEFLDKSLSKYNLLFIIINVTRSILFISREIQITRE